MAKSLDELYGELGALENAAKSVPMPQIQPWSKDMVLYLSLAILVFGLLVIVVMVYLVFKGKDADQVLRVCALPLIIVAAIFLVVVGYTSEQIAPVMGLLGAIAGYILGSKRSSE